MRRILITEDDKLLANIFLRHFEQEGFVVRVALDGRAAIELLKTDPPEIVVLDLMLPEVDGIGVLRFIRSHPSLRGLPVVILSNSSYFSGLAQSALEAGATAFLNKGDHGPKSLVAEVRKLLPPLAPVPEARAWNQPPPLPQWAQAASGRGPIRVIVADDDKVIQGVLCFFMEQAGYSVSQAYDGRKALEMAEATPPDVMVLDWMMPELDGFELLKIWQQHPKLSGIPVIMLTGQKEGFKRADALGSGAVEYITKPFSPDFLVELIAKHVPRP